MDKKQCSVKVLDAGGWHSFPCSKPITIERDGKPYCKIHDPEYIKAKDAKREAKRKAIACPKCGSHPEAWFAYCPFCGTKYPGKGG